MDTHYSLAHTYTHSNIPYECFINRLCACNNNKVEFTATECHSVCIPPTWFYPYKISIRGGIESMIRPKCTTTILKLLICSIINSSNWQLVECICAGCVLFKASLLLCIVNKCMNVVIHGENIRIQSIINKLKNFRMNGIRSFSLGQRIHHRLIKLP